MLINERMIEEIEEMAAESPRLRMNYNLHEGPDSLSHRLINVLLPGTPMPVHRHAHSDETFIILRGKLFVVFYDETGAEIERFLLDSSIGNFGVNIPSNQWHGIEVMETSAIFEVKDGPYTPLTPENILY
ncbi:MAG: WbuC family cupin fold metalloprotein [Muribaculaceae bacterium]|nr:WbuC family cupin fold metalloprotein [Muribaculaceae bacterium]